MPAKGPDNTDLIRAFLEREKAAGKPFRHEGQIATDRSLLAILTDVANKAYYYFEPQYKFTQEKGDCTQQIMDKLLRCLRRCKDASTLLPFLRKVARDACKDLLRESLRHKNILPLIDWFERPSDLHITMIQDLYRSLGETLLNRYVEGLASDEREVLILMYKEGLRPAEIAVRMGKRVQEVYKLKQSALKRLRRLLDPEDFS